jgi:hypothetical protein
MMTAIERAVEPLRQKAVAAAEDHARAVIERVRKDLEAHNWDIRSAAPYPYHSYTREGQIAKSKNSLYESLTKTHPDHRPSYIPSEPNYKVIDDDRAERYVEEMKMMAAAQYEAFVAKLVSKVGDHTTAELSTPTGVWDYSYVTIDGKDVWKTQCIGKYSKNGKYFHQWPTRKLVKGSNR